MGQYRVHKVPITDLTLSHPNAVHNLTSRLHRSNSIITFPYTPKYPHINFLRVFQLKICLHFSSHASSIPPSPFWILLFIEDYPTLYTTHLYIFFSLLGFMHKLHLFFNVSWFGLSLARNNLVVNCPINMWTLDYCWAPPCRMKTN